jgi:hypothetical protein
VWFLYIKQSQSLDDNRIHCLEYQGWAGLIFQSTILWALAHFPITTAKMALSNMECHVLDVN